MWNWQIYDQRPYLYNTPLRYGKRCRLQRQKAVDPNLPQELELKIQKIELFRDIKDKLVDKITLTIPLQQIDDEFADELSTLLLSKKGNVNLYVSVVDENSPNKIKLFFEAAQGKNRHRCLSLH